MAWAMGALQAEVRKLLQKRVKESVSREILEAAEAVISEQRFTSTNASMSAIAERAGIAVGTLYNYFRDKDELVRLILKNRQERFAEVLAASIEEHDQRPFAVQLHGVMVALFQLHFKHEQFWRFIFEGEDTGAPMRRPPWVNFIDQLERVTAKGVSEGLLNSQYKRLYAQGLAGLVFSYVIDEPAAATADPAVAAAESIVNFFLATATKRV